MLPITIQDYPQLSLLAWQLDPHSTLTPPQALALYERHWRHVDASAMLPEEQQLLKQLITEYGRGVFLC